MPEAKSPLELVQEILIDTRETVDKLLVDHDMIRIGIKTKFDLMINNLGFIAGKASPILAPRSPLKPMTEFMGVPIKKPVQMTEAALTPDEQRKKEFADKVEKLTKAFAHMTNQQIIDAYKADEIVIRGVARNAGLEKYRKNEVNISETFLDDIRTALGSQEVFNQNKIKVGKEFEDNDQQ